MFITLCVCWVWLHPIIISKPGPNIYHLYCCLCYITYIVLFVFQVYHHDVKWKHFPRYRPFVCGEFTGHRWIPRKGQWRRALLLFFMGAWINGWVNDREAGNLRRQRAHYDVTVMCASWDLCTRCVFCWGLLWKFVKLFMKLKERTVQQKKSQGCKMVKQIRIKWINRLLLGPVRTEYTSTENANTLFTVTKLVVLFLCSASFLNSCR